MTKGRVKKTVAKKPSPTESMKELTLDILDLPSDVKSLLNDAGLSTVQDILDKVEQDEDALTTIKGIKNKRKQTILKQLAEKGFLKIKEKNSKNGLERRFTFIVRLTVNDRGEALRGEIEHGQSGKKKPISGLDGQMLSQFMEATIQSLIYQDAGSLTEFASEKRGMPISEVKSLAPQVNLTVTSVCLVNEAGEEAQGDVVHYDEAVWVQVRFMIEGEGAASLAAKNVACIIKVYARPIAVGSTNLLKKHRLNLEKGRFEYLTKLPMSDLTPGVYSMVALVTLKTPAQIGGFLEGSPFEIMEDSINVVETAPTKKWN